MSLCDPFQDAFVRATGNSDPSKAVITSEEQWSRFRTELEEGGLLSEEDEDLLDDMWTELLKDAKLFQPQGKPRINITFKDWQRALGDRVPVDPEPAVRALRRIAHNVSHSEHISRPPFGHK